MTALVSETPIVEVSLPDNTPEAPDDSEIVNAPVSVVERDVDNELDSVMDIELVSVRTLVETRVLASIIVTAVVSVLSIDICIDDVSEIDKPLASVPKTLFLEILSVSVTPALSVLLAVQLEESI